MKTAIMQIAQEQATQIQFQTTNNGKPGTFKLKVYDLRIIP
jgi:hypothetical protein